MISRHTKADLLLARFPGPVTLYPSRKKWLLILVIGAVFTMVGAGMVMDGASGGWVALVFFTVVTIVATGMFLPGVAALTLDGDGFQVVSLFRCHRSRWRDVNGFEFVAISFTSQMLVAYDDSDAAGRTMASLNTALAGHNSALPDTYGLAGDDLARLLMQWRARALAA